MYTWVRRLYASVITATSPCYRQADVTTETNRQARLRTCLPGRRRLHLISRHHILGTWYLVVAYRGNGVIHRAQKAVSRG
jgi:hypothetical protein